jgi:hypothetical protein
MLLEFGYVGRLGRNLNQGISLNAVPFFMRDAASGQTFAQAFDAVASQIRAGVAAPAITPQSWFENQLGAGGTRTLAAVEAVSFRDGQVNTLWNTIQLRRLAAGLPPISNLQVFDLWMRADGGRSNYHAAFVTLRQRLSHGLTFALNYTLSNALDQAGAIQNGALTYSSAYDREIDYGPALFDRRHVFNANWVYDLPFGPGRRWGAGNRAGYLIGGWYLSGIGAASSGLPLTVVQSNQAWGGDPLNLSAPSGAIPLVKPNFGASVHSGVAGSTGVGTAGNPATRGTGLNLFADPAAVFNNFRKIRLSEDGRSGRGVLRGLSRWNLDLSIGKRTAITEKVKTVFSFDFLNVFNRVEYADPALDLRNPAAFGVLTAQFNTPRAIQFGFRLEW